MRLLALFSAIASSIAIANTAPINSAYLAYPSDAGASCAPIGRTLTKAEVLATNLNYSSGFCQAFMLYG